MRWQKSTRSVGCNPTKSVCNHHKVMYVINLKEINIQVLRLDDIPFAGQTNYILANARLHTNPSDCIKNPRSEERGFFGRGRRTRTLDARFWRPTLYQLSYTPILLIFTVLHYVSGFALLWYPKFILSWSDNEFRPLRQQILASSATGSA